MISIFIIAASDVARAGLESLLTADPDVTVVGSAANWTTLVGSGTQDNLPDIVIFDADRHDDEVTDTFRSLIEEANESHDVPAIIVIGAEREDWLRDALRASVVRATLPRAAASAEIVAAVQAVSNGLFAIDPEVFAALFSSTTPTDEPSHLTHRGALVDELTPREREVLEMLAEGLSNKEIAWRMKISEHTVKFHVASIFAKLDASSRTEAVMHGIRQGLIMM